MRTRRVESDVSIRIYDFHHEAIYLLQRKFWVFDSRMAICDFFSFPHGSLIVITLWFSQNGFIRFLRWPDLMKTRVTLMVKYFNFAIIAFILACLA